MSAGVPEPTYAQYVRQRPPGLRGTVRAAALSALAAAGGVTGSTDAALRRPRVQFLYLHHVLADEEEGFRLLLRELVRQHTIVGHTEAVERVRGLRGGIDKPYVTFSFDDGFLDNVRAARVLEEFGTTGCYFVCPGVVGERDPEKLRSFCAQRLDFPVVTPFLGWDDLENLRTRGHEIGGHTMTHPNLGAIGADDVEREVRGSYDELVRRLGDVKHFAWPKGRWENFSPVARDAVFRAGFVSCVSAVRGCHVAAATGRPDDLCLRRDHVMATWPAPHVRYLLARNSRTATAADNDWPAEYGSGGSGSGGEGRNVTRCA